MNGALFRKIISAIVVSVFLLIFVPQRVFAEQNQTEPSQVIVEVDGKSLVMDQPPVIVNSRTLVPMRAIFEKLGAEVEWNGLTQTVTAKKEGVYIQLTIGEKSIQKNAAWIPFDQAPLIVGNRTMVPVRVVAEALGAEVGWDSIARKVIVKSKGKAQSEGIIFDPELINRSTNGDLLNQANNRVIYDQEAVIVLVQEALEKRVASLAFQYRGSFDVISSRIADLAGKALDESPYYGMTLNKVNYRMEGSNTVVDVTIHFDYKMTLEQDGYTINKAKEILQQIINPSMTETEKIKAIHDYVVANYQYDQSYSIYDPYQMLIQKKGVCQAYALLTYLLLKTAGIDNTFVSGEAGGGGHAWNLVYLKDGRIYHMDTTWDDPVPDQGNKVRYDYYLKTDGQMALDHRWERGDYPASSAIPFH